jgi:hypothetical protein
MLTIHSGEDFDSYQAGGEFILAMPLTVDDDDDDGAICGCLRVAL